MRLRRALSGLLMAAYLAAAPIACTGDPVAERAAGLIVTQVPPGAGTAGLGARLDLATRYPEGSRILWVRPAERPDRYRVLSAGFFAAGAPALSPGADRMLFAGRQEPGDNWAIYETRVTRGRPSPVVDTGSDCVDPAYLAGDRLVFACSDSAGRSADEAPSWALYTARRDGSDLDRITWGPGSAFDPSPLPDGRVLFSMWQGPGVGRPAEGSVALFTANPDGTLLEPFAGSHEPPSLKARARSSADGDVIFLAADRSTGSSRLERLEMGRPQASRQRLALELDLLSAEPAASGELLVATTSGVFRWTAAGSSAQPIFDDPEWDELEALPLRPAPTPRNLPSPLDRSRTTGILVCYDAHRSDRRVGPPAEAPRPAEVEVAVRVGATRHGAASLARFPVETDGSFQLEVPADRPLRLRTMDSVGVTISESDWFWVRPGEVRACFGCHESRQAAPVNRPVMALTTGAARLLASREAEG